jgi:hypothetical protein
MVSSREWNDIAVDGFRCNEESISALELNDLEADGFTCHEELILYQAALEFQKCFSLTTSKRLWISLSL